MYKKGIYTVVANRPLTESVWRMKLAGDTQWITRPGQFVNVEIEGCYLRRPISVCDWEAERLTLVYKVVGKGTARMAGLAAGARLDLLTGLGNGFSVDVPGAERPVVAGGGVGVPPLYGLTKRLLEAGRTPRVVLGFNTASEQILVDDFRALGVEVAVATVDGSAGVKGFVTTPLAAGTPCDYLYACGPLPMLRAVAQATACEGQLSFEERMGCGFGACMGCTCRTLTGWKRICTEGPVLLKSEINWNND